MQKSAAGTAPESEPEPEPDPCINKRMGNHFAISILLHEIEIERDKANGKINMIKTILESDEIEIVKLRKIKMVKTKLEARLKEIEEIETRLQAELKALDAV